MSTARSPAREALAAGLPVALVAVLALAAWWLLSATVYAGKAYLFPGPQAVGAAVVENAATLGVATLITLKEASLGYLAAIVIGVLLAAVMSQSRLIERSLYPYAVLLQTVPVVAVLSFQITVLLGGALIVEQVFAINGLGTLAIAAVRQQDIPMLQGLVLVIVAMVVAVQLGTDILYGLLNPKARPS